MKKKILALITAVTMVLGMSMTAMAAENDAIAKTANVIIDYSASNLTVDAGTHDYSVYSVFTGTFALDDNKFTTGAVAWGDGISNAATTFGDAVTYANKLRVATAEEIISYSKELGAKVDTSEKLPTTTTFSGKKYTIGTLTQGYYLVVDNNDTTNDNNKYKLVYIANDGKNVTLYPKTEGITSGKKVQDNNNTEGTTTGLQDSADYDMGDLVPYTLIGTLPTDYPSYSEYTYEFHDTMDKGLTLDATSVTVYYTSNPENPATSEIISTFDRTNSSMFSSSTDAEGKTTFVVTLTNLKNHISNAAYDAEKKVVVKFNATLNDNAVIGSAGNWNEFYLVNQDGETAHDKVVVFTYKLVVNKVDQSNAVLHGAGFTLIKLYKVGQLVPTGCGYEEASATDLASWGITADTKTYQYVIVGTATPKTSNIDATNEYTVSGRATVSDTTSASEFTFSRIDDGDYILVESTTPNGYGTIEPIEFTVTATHEEEDDTPELVSLTGTNKATGSTEAFTTTVSAGSLETTIQNRTESAVLPSTGGIGTTIFYIIGGLLVIGAGVVLFTKKKMSTEE